MKKLYRIRRNNIIAGVCMGIARYFDVDVTLIRLLWVLAVLFGGAGIPAYIIAWIIIPEEPSSNEEVTVETESTIHESGAYQKTAGLIIVAIGVFFLLRNLFPRIFFIQFWPLIFIGAGLVLIFGGWRRS